MNNLRTSALIAHDAASAGVNGLDMGGAQYKGAIVFIDVSAISGTSPTLTVTVEGKSPDGTYYTILESAAISSTGLTVLRIYPGLAASANTVANDVLPTLWRVKSAIGGTGPSVTANIYADLID